MNGYKYLRNGNAFHMHASVLSSSSHAALAEAQIRTQKERERGREWDEPTSLRATMKNDENHPAAASDGNTLPLQMKDESLRLAHP
jgi:hypothetical protein